MEGKRLNLHDIILDKYKIVSIMKENEDVIVCLAEHICLNTNWVIKQYIESEHSNHMIKDSLEQEIAILKRLKHPGIPLIVDVYTDDNTITVIREYMEGNTLAEYIRGNGLLNEAETLDIGIKLCHILEYLHNLKGSPLIYRDLKPDNIIITSQKDIKLIDFGIARYYCEDRDADTTYLGTKGFAAPEQFYSQSDVRTDIFGLGSTLYYLLTQKDLTKPPYKHEPIRKLRKDISKGFEAILHQCLLMKKEERYQTASELQIQLESLVYKDKKVDLVDYLNQFKVKKIGVKALKAGAGATYLSLQWAMYLQKSRGESSLIYLLDLSEKQRLESMRYHNESIISDGIIEYRDIRILTQHSLIRKIKKMDKVFPDDKRTIYVVIDFGLDFEQLFSKMEQLTSVVIASISPWEVEIFEEFVLSPNRGKNHYVINFSGKEDFEMLKTSVHGLMFYRLPFNVFSAPLATEQEAIFDQILMKEGWQVECLKSEKIQYFSKIGSYIENFRERIKPLQ